jgi:prolyl-tRNA editing enzyme YbaK/EbsC (Cys-tRNA(Pro) deacylase)
MDLSRACQVVVDAAAASGVAIEISSFPDGTKTAEDAAEAVGCDVSAIVKSLVFLADDRPVVALVSGDHRLDTGALAEVMGAASVERAPLERVREATGFAAGGVPPFGHATSVPVYADKGLRRGRKLWAAGGTPSTVFAVDLDGLERLAQPTWVNISA